MINSIMNLRSRRTLNYIFTLMKLKLNLLALSPFIVIPLKIFIFSFIFIPVVLLSNWHVYYLFVVILLNLAAILSLVLLYNSSNKESYYYTDLLPIFTGSYWSIIEEMITNSQLNDEFLVIPITIGLSMIILGLLDNNKSITLKDKFLFIRENKKLVFIFILVIWLVIFTINMIFILLGLGIIIDTSSLTLFFLYSIC